jgi:hypothetical protein
MPAAEVQTPDFALLVSLLQTIGFDLHRIESIPGGSSVDKSGQGDASYSVNISCEQLGLHAAFSSRSRTEPSAITNTDPAVSQVRMWGLHVMQLRCGL